MTLSLRNTYFKGGIILASLSFIIIIAGGYIVFQALPGAMASSAARPSGIIRKLIHGITAPNAYVPYWTMLGTAAYSLISIVLIYNFFEKTQSPEILFFGLFVISLSFEFTRIMVPLNIAHPFPALYLIISTRVLLFGRYFGLFSLFAASVCAAGLDGQKQQSVFLISILASMVISLNVPVDNLVWDSTFVLCSGYSSLFAIVEAGILAVTIITFFVSAFTRGARTYIFIGIGAFLSYFGRNILLNSDTWITVIPGIMILAAGTWFVCARLHREYLWF